MAQKITFVVFGGTGDLMKRKLIPALIDMFGQGVLGRGNNIVAVGRREYDNNLYREFLCEGVENVKKDDLYGLPLKYFKGDISKENGLVGLGDYLRTLEGEEPSSRIFYFATSYMFFPFMIC